MKPPTALRLWTYSRCVTAWVGDVERPVVFAWDAATPDRIAVLPPGGEPLWFDRHAAACGVEGLVADWMWQCSRDGEPHVAIRPLVGDLIVVREDVLGRFLATTEMWVSQGREDFEVEAAALLGGAK